MIITKLSAREAAHFILEAVALYGDFPVYFTGQGGKWMVTTEPPAVLVVDEQGVGIKVPEPSSN